MYQLIAFDPGNAEYGVSESPIFKHSSGGACPLIEFEYSELTVRLFLQ